MFEHEQRLLFVTNLSEFLEDRNYEPSANALDASLDALSKVLVLHPEFTLKVVKLFLPIVPELVARQLSCEDTDAVNITKASRIIRNEKIALSLSLILPIVPQISYTVVLFFQSNATRLFQRLIDLEDQESDVENILSSMNMSDEVENSEMLDGILTICRATYNFLVFDAELFRNLWNWAPIIACATQTETPYGWLAARSTTIILRIPHADRRKYWEN